MSTKKVSLESEDQGKILKSSTDGSLYVILKSTEGWHISSLSRTSKVTTNNTNSCWIFRADTETDILRRLNKGEWTGLMLGDLGKTLLEKLNDG